MDGAQRTHGDVVIDLTTDERVTAEEFVSTAYDWATELADELARLAERVEEHDLVRAGATILDRRRANPLAEAADDAWRWQLVTDLLRLVEARRAQQVVTA